MSPGVPDALMGVTVPCRSWAVHPTRMSLWRVTVRVPAALPHTPGVSLWCPNPSCHTHDGIGVCPLCPIHLQGWHPLLTPSMSHLSPTGFTPPCTPCPSPTHGCQHDVPPPMSHPPEFPPIPRGMSPPSLWGVTQLCLLPPRCPPRGDTLMRTHMPRMFLVRLSLCGVHIPLSVPSMCSTPCPQCGVSPCRSPIPLHPLWGASPSVLPSVGCPQSVPISLSPRGVKLAEGPRRKGDPQVAEVQRRGQRGAELRKEQEPQSQNPGAPGLLPPPGGTSRSHSGTPLKSP